jgi:hypothetical protein
MTCHHDWIVINHKDIRGECNWILMICSKCKRHFVKIVPERTEQGIVQSYHCLECNNIWHMNYFTLKEQKICNNDACNTNK